MLNAHKFGWVNVNLSMYSVQVAMRELLRIVYFSQCHQFIHVAICPDYQRTSDIVLHYFIIVFFYQRNAETFQECQQLKFREQTINTAVLYLNSSNKPQLFIKSYMTFMDENVRMQ